MPSGNKSKVEHTQMNGGREGDAPSREPEIEVLVTDALTSLGCRNSDSILDWRVEAAMVEIVEKASSDTGHQYRI